MSVMNDVERIETYPDCACFECRESRQRFAALVRKLLPTPEVAEAMERYMNANACPSRDDQQVIIDWAVNTVSAALELP